MSKYSELADRLESVSCPKCWYAIGSEEHNRCEDTDEADCACESNREDALVKAAAAIRELESKNARLEDENVGLSAAADSLYFSLQDALDRD